MKNTIMARVTRVVGLFLTGLFISIHAFAQDKIEITTEDTGSWIERNWMWLAGAVLLLVLVILFSGSSSRSTTTTTVRDDFGNVKKVSTTEITE